MKQLWKRTEGLSLAELLVTIAVLAVITAITLPLFFSQTSSAHRATAIADGRGWSLALVEALGDVWNFGESGGTIALSGEQLTVSLINPNPSSASTVVLPVAVSPETTLTSGTIAGTSWCLEITNRSESVVFSHQGLREGASGCAPDGTVTYP